MRGNPAMPGSPLTSKPTWWTPYGVCHVGFFFAHRCKYSKQEYSMNRLLLIVTALLALLLCGMARANYHRNGNDLDDRWFERNRNDPQRIADRPFERNWYDFRRFDYRDNCQWFNERWFHSDRKDLQYFDDRPFDRDFNCDFNDLRYFDTGLIV
jgi:hypothetical protein